MNIEQMGQLVTKYLVEKKTNRGTHGYYHRVRVAHIANMINEKVGGDKVVVTMAALLHDIGRLHDNEDPDHGYRAAPSLFDASTDLAWVDPVEWGKIAHIVFEHCNPGPGDFLEMQIVKDADKLDLFRNKMGGPDPNRLALDISKNEILHFKNYVLTEESKIIQRPDFGMEENKTGVIY